MTEEQAARTSFREYILRRDGHERGLRQQWTIARWMAWRDVLLSPNIKAIDKPKSPQDFLRFPWEESKHTEMARKAEEYRVTDAEVAELNKIMEVWEKSRQKQNKQ